MKGGNPHLVPLSTQAVEILRDAGHVDLDPRVLAAFGPTEAVGSANSRRFRLESRRLLPRPSAS